MEKNRFYAFHGGVFPSHRKSATRNKPIRPLPQLPGQVILSLVPRGEPACEPVVRPGDHVTRGQLVGRPAADGTPVYASLSGVVEAVEPRPALGGEEALSVVIRTEEKGEELRLEVLPPEARTGKAGLEAIRLLGIGQMDGHAPALHRRLKAAMGTAVNPSR